MGPSDGTQSRPKTRAEKDRWFQSGVKGVTWWGVLRQPQDVWFTRSEPVGGRRDEGRVGSEKWVDTSDPPPFAQLLPPRQDQSRTPLTVPQPVGSRLPDDV